MNLALPHEALVHARNVSLRTILVVDDERSVREMLAQALEDSGYAVLLAYHGRHALDVIQDRLPDLVISDVMMPLVGGVELCQTLKSRRETAAIPVILMSAAGIQAGAGAGADAMMAKPFDLDAMDELVSHHLSDKAA